jgi:hypothetical protein
MTTFAAPSSAPNQDHQLTPNQWVLRFARGGKPFARVAASRAIVGRNRSRTDPTAGRFTHPEIASLVNDAFARFEHQSSELRQSRPSGVARTSCSRR